MKRIPFWNDIKWIYPAALLVGFGGLLLFGRAFVEDSTLISVSALREIKDASIDCAAFFKYISWRRIALLVLFLALWWKNLGKWLLFALTGWYGMTMGMSLYVCLLRYYLKGIFLWSFLYFPQILFYALALLCGLLLCSVKTSEKGEKLNRSAMQYLLIPALLAMLLCGMYAESYWNVALLQDFLKFF